MSRQRRRREFTKSEDPTPSTYRRVRHAIDAYDPDEAIRLIEELHEKSLKISIIRYLTNNLAGDIVQDLGVDVDLVNALVRDLRHVISSGFDLNMSFALAVAIELAFEQIVSGLDYNNNILKRSITTISVIVQVLNDLVSDKNLFTSLYRRHSVTASLIGLDRLTTASLKDHVSPYLSALVEIERIITEIEEREFVEPKLNFISQNSPISFSLDSIGTAIDIVTNWVVPWRRKHAEQMALLHEQEKQAAILATIAQTEQTSSENKRQQMIGPEKDKVELEQLKLLNAKLRLELQKEIEEYAAVFVTRHAPDVSGDKKLEYIERISKRLNTLAFSLLELHTPEPPPTLPEMTD